MTIRPFIFWPHLLAGITAGIVIVIMSVTGVLLTYERQLIAWSDSHLRSVPPTPDAPRLPVETLLERFKREHPGLEPTAVTLAAAPDATVVLAVPQRTLHLDAYSGQLLGEGAQGVRRVMSRLRAWHRWLAVEGEGRPAARAITACSFSSSCRAPTCGCRASGGGRTSAAWPSSAAAWPARRATSTGTT